MGLLTSFIAPTPQTANAANGSWTQTAFNGTSDGVYVGTAPSGGGTSLGLAQDLSTTNLNATFDGANYNADYAKGNSTAVTAGGITKGTGYNSTSSVLAEETTTNRMVSANVSNFDTSTTGWTVSGVTVTRVTTPIYQGTGSMRVTNSVAGGDRYAFTTTDGAVTAGLTYTLSAYVNIPSALNDSGMWLRVIQFNGAAVVADTNLWSTQKWSTTGWERISESFVVQPGATTAEVRVEMLGVGNIYVDAIQLEQKTFPTSWVAGASTRTAASLAYPSVNNLTLSSGTIETWVNVNNALKDNAVNRYIFAHCTDGATNANIIAMGHSTSDSGSWWAVTSDSSGNLSTVSVVDSGFAGGTLANGWHHFAMAWDSIALRFYIDGQPVGTPANSPYLPTAYYSHIYVGTWAGGTYGWANAPIDGVAIYSNAKSAEAVNYDFNLGTQIGISSYLSSGSYVSNTITAAGLYGNWGTLTYNTTPNSQTITIDVLDGSSNVIQSNVASGANLGLATGTYPAIKLRANLSTSSLSATPLLNDWSVGYSYDNELPTAPTGLAITTTSATGATLTWNSSVDTGSSAVPNDSTLRYDIERAPDNGGTPGSWGEAGGTCAGFVAGTTCTDSGLSANTKYWYKIRAKDAVGNYSSYLEETGTLMDAGFENRGDGVAIDGGIWTPSGTPQNLEYDNGTAKVGGLSWYTRGPATVAYGGAKTTADWNLNSNNSEIRFWVNVDSTNQNRVINDSSTNQTFYLYWNTLGALQVFTQRIKTGYTQDNYTNIDNYSTGWTQYRLVFDFSSSTFKLYKRTVVSGAWTPLKASGAADYNIPMRAPVGSEPTQVTNTLFRAYQDTNLWVDDIRYSNTGIAEGTLAATLTNAPVLNTPNTPTNDPRPTITNSLAPDLSFANAIVRLYDSTTQVAETTSDGNGIFTFSDNNYSQNLTEGAHNNLTVKALNLSGTDSAPSNTVSILVDTVMPLAPTTRTAAKVLNASGADVADNAWNGHNNSDTLYFAWSGASDPEPASFIKRYWVYFGPVSGAVPRISGEATSNSTVNISKTLTSPVSGTDYYLRIQTEDNAGNISSDDSIPTLFTYKFDDTYPGLPAYGTPTPAGWSTNNSFRFDWPSANDANSGLASYEYKRETDENWLTTTNLSVTGVQAYQTGVNFMLIRTLDNAGNRTDDNDVTRVLKIPYYYSDPSAVVPQNLQVDLSQTLGGTVNSFKFNWDAVTDAEKYYYSINETPTSQSDFVTVNNTNFSNFAKREGQNTFYLVAETSGGLANWSNPATVSFSLDTEEPTAPGNLSITDASNRGTNQYALTIMWVEAQTNTPDFSHYVVERSDDGLIFTERATLDKTNTGYLDTGLTNGQEYYYRVLSKDNVGNLSAASPVISKAPTGKFTTAPSFTSEPEVEAKATSATVTWSNNRSSNTIVEYGLDEDYGQTQGSFNTYDTSHTYELTGLSPGTTYHFRAQSLDPGDLIGYSYNTAYSDDYTFTTTQAPGISDVTVSEVRLTSAIITWKTTSAASSKILYGTTSTYGSSYIDNSGSQTTTHTVKIDGLKDSTIYNFKIQGTDIEGNILNSDNYVFETLTFPKLSDLRVEQVKNTSTSTVKIAFSSNVPTTAQISLSGRNQKEASIYDLKTEHEAVIAGLLDNSEYTISVRGRDQYGNETAVATDSYKTAFDTRAPLITNITTESSITGYGADAKGQVILSWETDEPATSQVYYGVGTGGTEHSNQTQKESSLSTTHVVVISGLKPSTVYHFHPASTDSSGNETSAEEVSILTDQAASSVLDLIVNSLESSLGWLFKVLNRR